MREIGIGEVNFGRYLKEYEGVGEEIRKEEKTLEKYKQYLKEETVFSVFFVKADTNGNLIAYDGNTNIEIRMENKEINGYEYNAYRRKYFLSKEWGVKVVKIDEQKKIVYVSHEQIRNEDRKKLEKIIEKELGKCVVPAKVIKVLEGLVLLDIGGMGIPGYMWVRNWSQTYTETISDYVQKGDIIKVAILGKNSLTDKQRKRHFSWTDRDCYECSRKDAMTSDPWKGLSEKLKKNDIIHARCKRISSDEGYFWGIVDGMPEINVFCSYASKQGDKVLRESRVKKADIILDEIYDVQVYKIDEEKRILRAWVIGKTT